MAYAPLHFVSHFMHGVGADDQEIRPAGLHSPGGLDHGLGGLLPAAFPLEHFDLGEIHGIHQTFGRMQVAQLFLDRLVDDAVILER